MARELASRRTSAPAAHPKVKGHCAGLLHASAKRRTYYTSRSVLKQKRKLLQSLLRYPKRSIGNVTQGPYTCCTCSKSQIVSCTSYTVISGIEASHIAVKAHIQPKDQSEREHLKTPRSHPFCTPRTTHFSIQLDESTLPGNEALLLAYVRFVMGEEIHEEHLFAKTLKTDTKVNKTRSNALNARLFAQLCDENDIDFQRLLSHTKARWLSKGACLSRFEDILSMEIPPRIINPFHETEVENVILQEELLELSTDEELKVTFKRGYQNFGCRQKYPENILDWGIVKKLLIAHKNGQQDRDRNEMRVWHRFGMDFTEKRRKPVPLSMALVILRGHSPSNPLSIDFVESTIPSNRLRVRSASKTFKFSRRCPNHRKLEGRSPGSINFVTYRLRESKWLMMFELMFENVYTSVNINDLEDY
ncbi:SCAN domain-containing protein 3 [Eumeta japonica]|uniref:SCAN domain-containing protein 3 n=1 Tax=Eumeta variegata TaxID=151549 RepID=A0A4C1XMC6_EUMVA|nr:SCAN domain-containing protein 3 [Eumeta japonica]